MAESELQVIGNDPYVVTINDNLTKELCEEMIDTFESDPNVHQGVTAGGIELDVKQSVDLHITSAGDHWSEIDTQLHQQLGAGLQMYSKHLCDINSCNLPGGEYDIMDTGYQMQKTVPGGFYHWHHDFMWYQDFVCGKNRDEMSIRSITFLWYLNDVQDGYTEFQNGSRVYPETGKLLLFPATWTYLHRGTPPKSDKYICTGWFYSRLDNELKETDRPAPKFVGPLRGELS